MGKIQEVGPTDDRWIYIWIKRHLLTGVPVLSVVEVTRTGSTGTPKQDAALTGGGFSGNHYVRYFTAITQAITWNLTAISQVQ